MSSSSKTAVPRGVSLPRSSRPIAIRYHSLALPCGAAYPTSPSSLTRRTARHPSAPFSPPVPAGARHAGFARRQRPMPSGYWTPSGTPAPVRSGKPGRPHGPSLIVLALSRSDLTMNDRAARRRRLQPTPITGFGHPVDDASATPADADPNAAHLSLAASPHQPLAAAPSEQAPAAGADDAPT